MASTLQLYHRLPYPAKVLIASVHGCKLHWWRYGSKTDQLVEDAYRRESWRLEAWIAWQQGQLEFLLDRAATRVPYYRDQWQLRRRSGDKASWKYLENWPVLVKEQVRGNNVAFLADDCNPRWMYCDHTSGSSGTPLKIWQSRETVQKWYALFEARWRGWYGLSRNDCWAILGGQLVTPVSQQKPPFWVWNAGLNQLYLSSYHLGSQNTAAYVQAIHRHKVTYLWGYASALNSLAQQVIEQHLEVRGVRRVVSNAEPLSEIQRDRIAQAFACPVMNTYGLSEAVCAASECDEGKMHWWPEAGLVEVLADDQDAAAPDGGTGRLVATGLLNPDMPLIRYQTGDRVATKETDESCGCGRRLPVLTLIEGRSDDMIVTRDGRKIGRLDPVFKADFHIREAQIIQEQVDHFRLRYVPAPGLGQGELDELVGRLRDRVGDVKVILEPTDAIPRTTSGKFRAVISHVKTKEQL